LASDMKPYAERFRNALQTLRRKLALDHDKQSKYGLTSPQFYILYMIREKGTCKVTALAEEMDVKPSAITVMIDRLVNHDFVERLQDKNDRRVVLMRITDEGQRVLHELEQHSNEIIGRYFSSLSSDEVEKMIETLEKITVDLSVQDSGRQTNGIHE
jgi:DNA-binding MarR family transcriptional regulator